MVMCDQLEEESEPEIMKLCAEAAAKAMVETDQVQSKFGVVGGTYWEECRRMYLKAEMPRILQWPPTHRVDLIVNYYSGSARRLGHLVSEPIHFGISLPYANELYGQLNIESVTTMKDLRR